MLSVNALVFTVIFIIIAVSIDAVSILSSYEFNTSVLSMVLFSLGFLAYLQYKWIKTASLKRDRSQAKTILIGSLIALVSLSADFSASRSHYLYSWIELIPFMWLLTLVFILNNYANQYNSFTFNISNLAAYVYDKFDEMICTVVIVTDTTEKEDLIRQLNESNTKIERFNKELQSEERPYKSSFSREEAKSIIGRKRTPIRS